jgi:hypothetical protein
MAGSLIWDETVSSCTGINCSSLRLPGTVSVSTPSPEPWVLSLFAAAGECLRLDVVTQDNDLEMVVAAPDGTVFVNDDRTGIDRRPLVAVPSAPVRGWYTVQIARFDGDDVVANFALAYGRYSARNANCSPPTPPLMPARGATPNISK